MIIRITGDERDVANSAWVSTLNEVRAQGKTQEQVLKVVGFLVEHHHTSPFESVTVTVELTEAKDNIESFKHYADDLYSVDDELKVTIDLLNFIKVTYKNELWDGEVWKLFQEARPVLAELISGFGPIQDSTSPDVSSLLGENHGMTVELVHLHDEGSDKHSRATWRIKCPLSIAVQILRHRKGSYNMVSGRYRTIFQELYQLPEDVMSTLEAAELHVDAMELFGQSVPKVIEEYEALMRGLKIAKKVGKIENDAYKRARECVRFALPEGRMTELYVTYYLSDFYGNFKKLRDSVHAQTEHIWIAQEMGKTISQLRQEN